MSAQTDTATKEQFPVPSFFSKVSNEVEFIELHADGREPNFTRVWLKISNGQVFGQAECVRGENVGEQKQFAHDAIVWAANSGSSQYDRDGFRPRRHW